MMTIDFASMSRWAIVAIASRIARHAQGEVGRENSSDEFLNVLNDTINAVECSAREAKTDSCVAQFVQLLNKLDSNYPHVVKCATAAASSAAAEGSELFKAAQDALNSLQCIRSECSLCHLELFADLERYARFDPNLGDDEQAPEKMLEFVHRQSVHEAGHLVATFMFRFGVYFAQIIYEPQVKLLPFENKLRQHQAYLAAGKAAEILIFGDFFDWALKTDKEHYQVVDPSKDFDDDVMFLKQQKYFSKDAIIATADLLRKRILIKEPLDRDLRNSLSQVWGTDPIDVWHDVPEP